MICCIRVFLNDIIVTFLQAGKCITPAISLRQLRCLNKALVFPLWPSIIFCIAVEMNYHTRRLIRIRHSLSIFVKPLFFYRNLRRSILDLKGSIRIILCIDDRVFFLLCHLTNKTIRSSRHLINGLGIRLAVWHHDKVVSFITLDIAARCFGLNQFIQLSFFNLGIAFACHRVKDQLTVAVRYKPCCVDFYPFGITIPIQTEFRAFQRFVRQAFLHLQQCQRTFAFLMRSTTAGDFLISNIRCILYFSEQFNRVLECELFFICFRLTSIDRILVSQLVHFRVIGFVPDLESHGVLCTRTTRCRCIFKTDKLLHRIISAGIRQLDRVAVQRCSHILRHSKAVDQFQITVTRQQLLRILINRNSIGHFIDIIIFCVPFLRTGLINILFVTSDLGVCFRRTSYTPPCFIVIRFFRITGIVPEGIRDLDLEEDHNPLVFCQVKVIHILQVECHRLAVFLHRNILAARQVIYLSASSPRSRFLGKYRQRALTCIIIRAIAQTNDVIARKGHSIRQFICYLKCTVRSIFQEQLIPEHTVPIFVFFQFSIRQICICTEPV